MNSQSRKGAVIEAGANLAVGFTLAFLINYLALNVLHLSPTAATLFVVGLVVTVASVLRSFVMRRIFEGRRIRQLPPSFLYIVDELARERHRQISGEGYTLDHDDRHDEGQLADGAAAYCLASVDCDAGRQAATAKSFFSRAADIRTSWPWDLDGFKPESPRRCLVKAGAMIIAEIGRLDRLDRSATLAKLNERASQ